MKLKDLLEGVAVLSCGIDTETEIRGISFDSQTTQAGDLFVAIAGEVVDGRCYIHEALEKGAVCAVCDRPVEGEIPVVSVENARKALADISANYFGHPAQELTVVGVTGTNGKTTTTYLIKHILEKCCGAKVGLIGTVCNMIGKEELPAQRTTPESYEVQELLRRMVDDGCSYAVMEVSSHALAMERVRGIFFTTAAFTNLTQDHLDFHGTMERYCDAKAQLFEQCGTAVYNRDDPWYPRMLRHSRCCQLSFGIHSEAEVRASDVHMAADHVAFCLHADAQTLPVQVAIPGVFTVYNALTALAVCSVLGVSLQEGAAALRDDHGAKGRMEVVPTPGKPYTVLIDYAHTPDALENVLRTVRGFAKGRTVALFGCGGDRDRGKRPQMGEIAGRLADFTVVTTDNPRTESPEAIIADIVQGIPKGALYCTIVDREEAICWALAHGQADDVIVLCGKGHEDYVEINHEKYPQDERKIVAQYMKNE